MLDSSNDPAALGNQLACGLGGLRRLSLLTAALVVLCAATVAGAATTTPPTTAPATTKSVDAPLLAFLVAENTKTISKIRTQQYHADETQAALPEIPKRAMPADVVREGANAWWRMQMPLKNADTGVISPMTILAMHTKAGAVTWYEDNPLANMYEAEENGVLPEPTMKYQIGTKQPVDVLQVVAAQGNDRLGRYITAYSSPPRSFAVERDVKDPNFFHITMFGPEYDGPQAVAVLDAGKGYLMTKMTFYRAPREIAEEVRVELGQLGADRLWFPTSYEHNFYGGKDPKTVTRFRTSRLSNIVLNEPLPPDAFNVSRLNFPDGQQVMVHPVAGKGRLLVWFKGALIDQDAYMALMIASRKPANGVRRGN